jgi:hypothetical protein
VRGLTRPHSLIASHRLPFLNAGQLLPAELVYHLPGAHMRKLEPGVSFPGAPLPSLRSPSDPWFTF